MLTDVFSSWCSGVNSHNDSMTKLKRQGCGAMIQIYGNTILTTAWLQKLRGLMGTQNIRTPDNMLQSRLIHIFIFLLEWLFLLLRVCPLCSNKQIHLVMHILIEANQKLLLPRTWSTTRLLKIVWKAEDLDQIIFLINLLRGFHLFGCNLLLLSFSHKMWF